MKKKIVYGWVDASEPISNIGYWDGDTFQLESASSTEVIKTKQAWHDWNDEEEYDLYGECKRIKITIEEV